MNEVLDQIKNSCRLQLRKTDGKEAEHGKYLEVGEGFSKLMKKSTWSYLKFTKQTFKNCKATETRKSLSGNLKRLNTLWVYTPQL